MGPFTPRVSIMIPTYKQAEVLGMAIESALAQDYPHLEVIVSDDASPDGTRELVARYLSDPRLVYRRNERNLGRVGNYRKALYDYATGDWALNLDGDDYLCDPTYVRRALEASLSRPNVVMVVAGVRPSDSELPDEVFCPSHAPWEHHSGESFFYQWRLSTNVPHLGTLYDRRLATSIGFYGENVLFADCESLRRLCLHGDLLLHDQVVGVWRSHAHNASHGLEPELHVANLGMILAPYRYAKTRGLDPVKLEHWRDRNLREYSQNYLHRVIEAQRLDYAMAYLERLRLAHPAVFQAVLLRLIGDGRALAKILLLRLGGKPLMERARSAWNQLRAQQVTP